ncbi:hypothetical protein GH714_017969 [Hevea brasiliensis]|uniref:Uncharacterized protein n=2 Tax=Hevea brasiliensis TaxID=3981 RepID=A0A6A6KW25_HEVBR|nr:hypothetical protein GH714_017969 [Hevea brasiliensis]
MLRFKEKRWDSKSMLGSGGMPSSHSATVTALALSIGLQEGTGSPAFAIAVVLACVVMYDASGVRLHAGRQAELLNQIVCEFPPEHPLSSVRPLRELLGHTPLQVVVGALVGCIVAYLMRNTDSYSVSHYWRDYTQLHQQMRVERMLHMRFPIVENRRVMIGSGRGDFMIFFFNSGD